VYHLFFTSPQPAGGEKLAEIPVNLRGTWNCTYDSVGERKCLEDGGYFIGSDQIEIKEKNKTSTWKIGQEVEMLKLNDFYVLNFVQTQKMFNSKGKEVVSPLYSAMVITESEGAITTWNVNRPWDNKSARKFRKAEILSDKMVIDTTNNETNLLLNFSLDLNDLEQISFLKPFIILGSDSTILSGDDIEWGDYNCGEISFEKKSDERKYYRLENKQYRMIEKQAKIERKQNVLFYNNQYAKVIGDAQKGYMLVITEDFYSDTSQYKHELFYLGGESNEETKYEVYQLIEFDKEVVPTQYNRRFFIDETKMIPNEIAQDLIKSNRISFVTFTEGGKPVERGVDHWNHLSDEDKEFLQQFLRNIEY
jgi:hypothetical protein